jgi:protocatechuate 3,4-dioxygenase beta subunit
MKPFENPTQRLGRRQFLEGGLGLLGVAIAADLFACNSTAPTATSAGTVSSNAVVGSSSTYASGGTSRMLASYPDPFTAADAPCVVYPEMTEGPCYAATLMRQDVSEGYTGLPVRLSLKVINAATCGPVPNATVDIWHTNAAGIYSAMAAGTFCNPTKEDLSATHFGRGVQTADANGRVDFHTIFPGWYSSRTIHIHFRVRIGDTAYETGQLFFDDALTDEILANHVDYKARSKRDTTNANDTVMPKTNQANYVLSTALMTDGVLQAWKTIAIKV